MTLKELCALARGVVPGELQDVRGWVHYRRFFRWRADWLAGRRRDGQRAWLRKAQDLLRHFAESPRCRLGRPRRTNLWYCPPAPYGEYLWKFHVDVVQCLLRPTAAFGEGVRRGRRRGGDRDDNPHREGSVRRVCWDRGFILGANWGRVLAWAEKFAAGAGRQA